MTLEQIQTREKINQFLNSKWGSQARFEEEKVHRPTPNHFLSYEIYSITTNPSEHETISELSQMEKEGLLKIEFMPRSGFIWYVKQTK